MEEDYGRRMYHRPPRQEWGNSPQYYVPNVMDQFGMTGGGYMGPAMIRPGNMGPPMLPSAFQHQAPYNLPPPGPAHNSNMAFRQSSDLGARGAVISSQALQINPYTNQHETALVSPMQG